jgi:hypothetical protein
MLLKNLDKFYNKVDVPWVHLIWEKYYSNDRLPNHTKKGSFWWRENLKLLASFKGPAKVSVGKGDTCYLWHDLWGGQVFSQDFSELFSFAKNKNQTIHMAKTIENLDSIFHLPLSTEAFGQLVQLAETLENLTDTEERDLWTYIWGSPWFSASKANKNLIGYRFVPPIFKWLWKSAVQMKHKVYFWLLLKDRLSTRNILRRKNRVLPSYECVLCSTLQEETVEHLFLNCQFAQACWGLLHLFIPQGDPNQVLTSFKDKLYVGFFMDIIIIMSWCIWMAKNDLIFSGIQPDILSVKRRFRSEFALVILRAKESHENAMTLWLSSHM